MDQMQSVQTPAQAPMAVQPGVGQAPKKKGGWLKWVIIVLIVLIVGGLAWWILTP
jgi:hypothetical protein